MSKTLLFKITKKDFEITWFSGSGSGGQHRNKSKNCCRLKHIESGIITTGQFYKSRQQNQKEALEGMVKNKKWKMWHTKKCSELMLNKEKLKTDYDKMCIDSNFKYEIKINGKWFEVDKNFFDNI